MGRRPSAPGKSPQVPSARAAPPRLPRPSRPLRKPRAPTAGNPAARPLMAPESHRPAPDPSSAGRPRPPDPLPPPPVSRASTRDGAPRSPAARTGPPAQRCQICQKLGWALLCKGPAVSSVGLQPLHDVPGHQPVPLRSGGSAGQEQPCNHGKRGEDGDGAHGSVLCLASARLPGPPPLGGEKPALRRWGERATPVAPAKENRHAWHFWAALAFIATLVASGAQVQAGQVIAEATGNWAGLRGMASSSAPRWSRRRPRPAAHLERHRCRAAGW